MISASIILFCCIVALLELDTTYAFQLTFSRGIVTGPLLSLLTGDLMAGLQVGIFTELLFADINPLGGVLPPSAVICCGISLLLHFFGVPLSIAFFFGVLAAIAFSYAERWTRKTRSNHLAVWEKLIRRNSAFATRLICLSLLNAFLTTLLLFIVLAALCTSTALWLLPHLTERALIAFSFAFIAVPWIGMTSLIASFRLKTK